MKLCPTICYHKELANSTSKEGEAARKRYPFIPYDTCRDKCDGRAVHCSYYEQNRRLESTQSQVPEVNVGRLEEFMI